MEERVGAAVCFSAALTLLAAAPRQRHEDGSGLLGIALVAGID